MSTAQEKDKPAPQQFVVGSVTQALPFPPGKYRFFVRSAMPLRDPKYLNLPFPCLLIAAAPGLPPDCVEFEGRGPALSTWLYRQNEQLIIKIGSRGAILIFSSLRTETTELLDVQVDRIDADKSAKTESPKAPGLKMQFDLYLRGEGDLHFVNAEWAGKVGASTWIESMAITPLEGITAADIEYKGLAANGFETPWLSNGAVCGSKGANMPLVGFAIRLKGEAATRYECEYAARFRSGATVATMRNGAPCRSKIAGDPLEAVQLRVVPRTSMSVTPAGAEPGKANLAIAAKPKAAKPSFSKFREQEAAVAPPKTAAKPAAKLPASKAKKAAAPVKSAARGKAATDSAEKKPVATAKPAAKSKATSVSKPKKAVPPATPAAKGKAASASKAAPAKKSKK